MNYRWYLELQLWCRLCALIRHGLEDQAPRKYVVRLGFVLSERTESRRRGRPASDAARRVSPTAAARRPRPDRAGHAAPGRAFITASARPSHPALPFRSRRPFFSAAAAAERPQLRHRHSRAQPAPSHSSTTTKAPPSSQRPTASSRAR